MYMNPNEAVGNSPPDCGVLVLSGFAEPVFGVSFRRSETSDKQIQEMLDK